MRAQLFDRRIFPLQLLLCEQRVNLGMARAADAHRALHRAAIELALVSFVVMPRARNEVMPRQCFLTPADGAMAAQKKWIVES